MLTTIAFVTALGVLPQTGAASRVTARLDLEPRLFGGTSTTGEGFRGGASLSLHPLVPIVDDGAPPALQPFLQGVSSVTVSGAAVYDLVRNLEPREATGAGVSLAADVVIARWVVVGATLGWARRSIGGISLPDSDGAPLYGGLSVGFRLTWLRLELGWASRRAVVSDYTEPDDHVSARLRAVLGREVDLRLEWHSYGGGLFEWSYPGALVGATWYPARNFGVGFELTYTGASEWSGSDMVSRTVGAALRASWWQGGRLGVDLAYAVASETDGREGYVRHALQLGATLRLPGW